MQKDKYLKRTFEINGGMFKVHAWFNRPEFDLHIMDYDGKGLDNWEYYLKHKDNEIKAALRDLCLESNGRGIMYKSGIMVTVRD